MKRRWHGKALILLILGYAGTVSCQLEPVITGFRPMVSLTWSNQQVNTYCDIEWMGNVGHEWVPWGLNLQATQSVTSLGLETFQMALDQIQWLFRNAPDGTLAGYYFRVISSEEPIGARSFTNMIRLVNLSTSVLSSVTFGLKQGGASVPLTNFAMVVQMATSDMVSVWSPYPGPSSLLLTNPPVVPAGDVEDGWYVSYEHSGSTRTGQLMVLPFGPAEKNVLLTVSNTSLTVNLEWLRLTQTRLY